MSTDNNAHFDNKTTPNKQRSGRPRQHRPRHAGGEARLDVPEASADEGGRQAGPEDIVVT